MRTIKTFFETQFNGPLTRKPQKPITLFLFLFLFSCSPRNDWVIKPVEEWPQIAMINEVWYHTGEQYIDPSFEYAGTSFLIDTGKDTIAATAKHVLWIAKTKAMQSVDLPDLERWIMHPKGNYADSVVINQLINHDRNEYLSGSQSTITQRDWLVFTVEHVSPNIQPLKPRFSRVRVGEKIWYLGCPYQSADCVIEEATVLEVSGNRIVFSRIPEAPVAGASGSPLIDKNGYLIGILSGTSVDKQTGNPALYGLSTHYLRKIVEGVRPLNVPLISITDLMSEEIEMHGIGAGLKKFAKLKSKNSNHFVYDFSVERINELADKYLAADEVTSAISLYSVSIDQLKLPKTLNKLANAYLIQGDTMLAEQTYQNTLELSSENLEAKEALERMR